VRRQALAIVVLSGLVLSAAARADNFADGLEWRQHPGARLDPAIRLRDEAGHAVVLESAFGGAPVILDLGYYHCPSLCSVVRGDLHRALRDSGLRAGSDYVLVALSIDPAEQPADAASAKAADLATDPDADPAAWHYLTGKADAIAAVGEAVGFRARYDNWYRQFMHPSGLVVLDGSGAVNGYLLGVGYGAGDLRAAVLRAGSGGAAQAALPVLLLCFHFDPTTGRYTLAVEKLLRVMGVLTVVTLGGLMAVLHRRRRP
jgi:protein SCO1/2